MNSRKHGDVGLGAAIAFLTELGYTVSIPLTDSQCYDLVVDLASGLKRVQVKTCRYKRRGKYEVELRTKGGNKTRTGKTKLFDTQAVDYVFVLTGNGDRYWIPSTQISSKNSLILNEEFSRWMVVVAPTAGL